MLIDFFIYLALLNTKVEPLASSMVIQNQKIAPEKELVFLPAGGTSTKGVQGIIGILGGKSEELPAMLIDSDNNGIALKKNLIAGLYKGDSVKHIISTQDITGIENSEVEDIVPYSLLQKAIEKILRNDDDLEFEDAYSATEPLIPQIEKFAEDNGIELKSGWKVTLAKNAKTQLLKSKNKIEDKYVKMWIDLFGKFTAGEN